jgi:hypothetical protein
VLQDFLFHMINLWSSMKVSHLHLYTQLLPSSEWQLCFTRRYSSAVWRTFCVICAIFKIDGEQNFQSHLWYPSQYSDWAMGTELWFLAGVELVLLDCPGAHQVSCLLHTRVMCVGINQLWCEDGRSPPCSVEANYVSTLLQYCCVCLSFLIHAVKRGVVLIVTREVQCQSIYPWRWTLHAGVY